MDDKKQFPVVATHMGVEIRCDESGEFHWSVEKYSTKNNRMYEVKDAIEKYLRQKELSQKVKLSIPVVAADGREATLTGIHGGNKDLLTTPKLEDRQRSSRVDEVYYRTPAVISALIRLKELQIESARIEETLEPCLIEKPGYRDDPKDLTQWIVERCEKAKVAAMELGSV